MLHVKLEGILQCRSQWTMLIVVGLNHAKVIPLLSLVPCFGGSLEERLLHSKPPTVSHFWINRVASKTHSPDTPTSYQKGWPNTWCNLESAVASSYREEYQVFTSRCDIIDVYGMESIQRNVFWEWNYSQWIMKNSLCITINDDIPSDVCLQSF